MTASASTSGIRWDANSQRTQLSLNGQTQNATYDAAGQLATLSDSAGNITRFTYDAAGRLTAIERSDGSSSHYRYTADGHLSGIEHLDAAHQPLARFDYTHNANGQRTQAVEELPNLARTITWQHDAAGQLTEERITQTRPTVHTLTTQYTHDAVGNRTQKTVTGAESYRVDYVYDQNDRLTEERHNQRGTTRYRYDGNGNLSEKEEPSQTTRYRWNSDNRLIKVERGSTTIEYAYDPQGRRIKKLLTDGSTRRETHYLIDAERPYHEIVTERTQTNNGPASSRTYLHTPGGLGELISDTDGTTTRQIYSDGQGSTRLITGNGTQTYSYDAFGNLTSGTANASHLYSGEHYDPDTGLIHLRARDYDPRIGRFISMDEHPGDHRIPLTLNKYLYANADPVNFRDPSGYTTLTDVPSESD